MDLGQITITGNYASSTGAYDLVITNPFIDLLIYIIVICFALYGFRFISKLFWK